MYCVQVAACMRKLPRNLSQAQAAATAVKPPHSHLRLSLTHSAGSLSDTQLATHLTLDVN
jgi:hypothetical protein